MGPSSPVSGSPHSSPLPEQFSDEEERDWFISMAEQGSYTMVTKLFNETLLSPEDKGKALSGAILGWGGYNPLLEERKQIATLLLSSQTQPIESRDIGNLLVEMMQWRHSDELVALLITSAKDRILPEDAGRAVVAVVKREYGLFNKTADLLLDQLGDRLSSAYILMALSFATKKYDDAVRSKPDCVETYAKIIDRLHALLHIAKSTDPRAELQAIFELFKSQKAHIDRDSAHLTHQPGKI